MTKFSSLKFLALGASALALYSCVPLDDGYYTSYTDNSYESTKTSYPRQNIEHPYFDAKAKKETSNFGCNSYNGKCYDSQNPIKERGPLADVVGFYKDSSDRAFAIERISNNELYFIYLDKDCYFVNKAEYVNHINKDYTYFRVEDTSTPFYLRFDPRVGAVQIEGYTTSYSCISRATHPFYRTSTDGRVQDNYRRFYDLILDGKIEGNGYKPDNNFYDNKAPGENSWNHGYYRRGYQSSQWSVQEPRKNGQYYQGEGRFLNTDSAIRSQYKKDYYDSNSYGQGFAKKGFSYYGGSEFEAYPSYRYRVSDDDSSVNIEIVDNLILVKPQGYNLAGPGFSIPLSGYKVQGVQYRDLDGDGRSELIFLLSKKIFNRQMVKIESTKALIYSPDRFTRRLNAVAVPDLINYNGYFGKDRWGYKDGLVTRTINTNIQGNTHRTFYYSLRNEGDRKVLSEINIKSWND